MKMYGVRQDWPYEIWDLVYFSKCREHAQLRADMLGADDEYSEFTVEELDLND